MADALKFMVEFIDKVTRPASVASAAVSRLEANLSKLKATVGEVAALGKIKFPTVGGATGGRVGGGGEKQQDAHVRAKLAHEKELAKAAAQLDKQRAAGLAAQGKATERAEAQAAKAAERATAAKQKQLDKQMAAREKHDEKTLKAAEKLAQKEKSMADKATAKAAKDVHRAAAAKVKAADKAAAAERKAFEKGMKQQEKAFKAKKKEEAKQAAAATEALNAEIALAGGVAGAAAAAALALGAAFAYVAFQGASLAIAAAEAKNDTLDMLEAMLGSAEAAQRVNAAIEDVTRDTAVSQAAVREMASSLTAAGVTNEVMLLDAVKAIAQTESVLKGAGAKIQGIVEKAAATGKFQISTKQLVGTGVQLSVLYKELAARTGKGVDEVEKELKAGKISAEVGIAALTKVLDQKFGAVAAKQALDFGAQMQRAKDNIGRLFEDINTGPFLDALGEMLKLLDASTPSGAALKEMVTTIFDGLFKAAATVLPFVRVGLKGIILIALKLWNAFRPVAVALGQAFGVETTNKLATFEGMVILVADAIGVAATAIAGLLQNKTLLDGIVLAFQMAGIFAKAIVGAIGLVVLGIGALLGVGATLTAWIVGLGAQAISAGNAIVTGLVEGIKNGAGMLINGVRNLAASAIATFENTFKVGSPSKVMMDMGGFLTQGLAQGIDKGAKAVNDNMGNVVSLDSVRARAEQAPAPAGTTNTSSASIQITFTEGSIQINGTNMSLQEVRELFPDVMVDALERALLSRGGGRKVA